MEKKNGVKKIERKQRQARERRKIEKIEARKESYKKDGKK